MINTSPTAVDALLHWRIFGTVGAPVLPAVALLFPSSLHFPILPFLTPSLALAIAATVDTSDSPAERSLEVPVNANDGTSVTHLWGVPGVGEDVNAVVEPPFMDKSSRSCR